MKVFMTGGTGFIGRHLASSLAHDGHSVTLVTRSAKKATDLFNSKLINIVEADPSKPGEWQKEIEGVDAVINLCGEKILGKRWNDKFKQRLLDSRIPPTQLIVDAIATAKVKPEVLVNGSAIGIYGDRGPDLVTEEDRPGKDFSAYLCRSWEETANKAESFGIRVVNIRTGLVLGDGGALIEMSRPFKFNAGGPIGSGNQYMSWIHINDHVGITKLCLLNREINGPVNLTASNPVTNSELMNSLGKALGRKSWLRVPAFMLKLMFGEGASLLLEGQRVLPVKVQKAGYNFKFESLTAALNDLLTSDDQA